MNTPEEHAEHERIFTLAEATGLLPELHKQLIQVKLAKHVLIQTREEIKKASAHAALGGGSAVGPRYIQALEQINYSLHAIHESGVLVKDLDMGLCDFPYLLNGRVVYLCWKLGEDKIEWWHEVHRGYADRQILPGDAF